MTHCVYLSTMIAQIAVVGMAVHSAHVAISRCMTPGEGRCGGVADMATAMIGRSVCWVTR
jgi:hypothetical protein